MVLEASREGAVIYRASARIIVKELIIKLKKENDKFSIIESCVDKYYDSGVWALYNENDLLEVAQTSCVAEEVLSDVNLIITGFDKIQKRKRSYKARRLFCFNTEFHVSIYDKNRTEAKYRHLSEQSEELEIYYLSESRGCDRSQREEIEYKYAIDHKAEYWNAFGKQRKLAREYYETKRGLQLRLIEILKKVIAS
ncbi:MAG: hypothetical protein K5669_11310 [Lachnospiraceae bacterium]|nr:hypothetical protein [Lachnospiraceae bacterium]